ncbi:MAG: fimbria/pilus periplasmic chaperone [Pseudomonadota bacterium]|nr:fimbria/pilus periplasmic chaperone [Pseudomonadota bacterium]
MLKSKFSLIASLLLSLASTRAADAAGFDVHPITVETRDGSGVVVVTNSGDRRVYLESHILDWSQDPAGNERLTEAETAVVSPPGTWVQPNSSYSLRLRLPASGTTVERAFRIVIRQLPERGDLAGGRVVFALTQNLPAFVAAADSSPPQLSARLIDPQRILIQNSGGRRARITSIVQDGRVVASGLIGYALAQGGLSVVLPHPVHPGTFDVETDIGRRNVALR